MKMFKKIPVFILLFTGYLCNAQEEETSLYPSSLEEFTSPSPATGLWSDHELTSRSPATGLWSDHELTSPRPTTGLWTDHELTPPRPTTGLWSDHELSPRNTTTGLWSDHELSPLSTTTNSLWSDHDPERSLPTPEGRSLPTLVVAGVSIALVLLCILIVAIFWYAWKKSQEGSIELNPIPYSEAGVSLRSLSVPENQ